MGLSHRRTGRGPQAACVVGLMVALLLSWSALPAAAAPVNTVPPAISGSPTGASFTLGLAQLGTRITVEETVSDGVEAAAGVSSPTSVVGRATRQQRSAPEIVGTARLGQILAAAGGRWSPAPQRVRVQWLRDGVEIPGADRVRYRVGWEDVGHRLKARVRVTGPGYVALETTTAGVRARHRVAARRVATYTVRTRGRITTSLAVFARQAAATYADPRGWRGRGVQFRRVARGGDFTLVLSEAAQVPSFSSGCSVDWSCRVGRYVIINQTRWRAASPAWLAAGMSRRDYRHMVVNHETGHWLGFGHAYCPARGRKAPVMQQQSKGLQGCRANPWPTLGELRGAGRRSVAPFGLAGNRARGDLLFGVDVE